MSQELINTSAPSGLKPGSKGFCTVVMTAGLGASWIERLESLSGYRAIFPLGDPRAGENPVNFSHWRLTAANQTRSVLSRVCFAGADYSQRSNRLAHHILLEAPEQAPGGPAWMMRQPGIMRTQWNGQPEQLPSGPSLPRGDRAPAVCTAWAAALGDAGWAGTLAQSFIEQPAKPAFLIYAPGADVLALFDEALSLLPPTKRWEVSFSTFFTELPLNVNCAWRGVVAGTPSAKEAMRLGPRALVIDLTHPNPAVVPSGPYAEAARAGSGPVFAAPPASKPAAPVPVAASAGPEIGFKDDEMEDTVAADLAEVSTAAPRKRLGATAQIVAIPDHAPSSHAKSLSFLPTQTIVYRGVRWWVLLVTAAACLAIGVGTGYLLHDSIKSSSTTNSADHQIVSNSQQPPTEQKPKQNEASLATTRTTSTVTNPPRGNGERTSRSEQSAQANSPVIGPDSSAATVPGNSSPATAIPPSQAPQTTPKNSQESPIFDYTAADKIKEIKDLSGDPAPKQGSLADPKSGPGIVDCKDFKEGDYLSLIWPDCNPEYSYECSERVAVKLSGGTSPGTKLNITATFKNTAGISTTYLSVIVRLEEGQLLFQPTATQQDIDKETIDRLRECVFIIWDSGGMPRGKYAFQKNISANFPLNDNKVDRDIILETSDIPAQLANLSPEDWDKPEVGKDGELTYKKKNLHFNIELKKTKKDGKTILCLKSDWKGNMLDGDPYPLVWHKYTLLRGDKEKLLNPITDFEQRKIDQFDKKYGIPDMPKLINDFRTTYMEAANAIKNEDSQNAIENTIMKEAENAKNKDEAKLNQKERRCVNYAKAKNALKNAIENKIAEAKGILVKHSKLNVIEPNGRTLATVDVYSNEWSPAEPTD